MPYVQTEYWKEIVRLVLDETLESWITSAGRSIPEMKRIAANGSPDSPIYEAIAREESDLALYLEEMKRRLAQKG